MAKDEDVHVADADNVSEEEQAAITASILEGAGIPIEEETLKEEDGKEPEDNSTQREEPEKQEESEPGKSEDEKKPEESVKETVPEKEEEEPKKTDGQLAIEAVAKKAGWIDKTNFKGADGKVYKSAENYILDGQSMSQTNKHQNDKLRSDMDKLTSGVDLLIEKSRKEVEAEYEQKFADLKAEKNEAIRTGDPDEVKQVETKIDELNKEKETQSPQETPQEAPEVVLWKQDNPWYASDPEKKAIADTVANKYTGTDLNEMFTLIDARIAKIFPTETEPKKEEPKKEEAEAPKKPERQKPVAAVESVTNVAETTKTAKKFTYANLSAEAKEVCDWQVKTDVFKTRQEYVDELAKTGELV